MADVESFVDIDGDFEMETNFYFNRLNNNQYTKTLIRVPKDTICNVVEKYIGVLRMETNQNYTNWPRVRPLQKWCPVRKVNGCEFW